MSIEFDKNDLTISYTVKKVSYGDGSQVHEVEVEKVELYFHFLKDLVDVTNITEFYQLAEKYAFDHYIRKAA